MLQIIVNYSAKFTYKFKQCEKFNVEKSIIFDIFMNLPWHSVGLILLLYLQKKKACAFFS